MSWRERIGRRPAEVPSFVASSSQQDSMDAEAADLFGVGEGAVHPCWQPVTLPSGLHVFENRYTGGTVTTLVFLMPLYLTLHNFLGRWRSLAQTDATASFMQAVLSCSVFACISTAKHMSAMPCV